MCRIPEPLERAVADEVERGPLEGDEPWTGNEDRLGVPAGAVRIVDRGVASLDKARPLAGRFPARRTYLSAVPGARLRMPAAADRGAGTADPEHRGGPTALRRVGGIREPPGPRAPVRPAEGVPRLRGGPQGPAHPRRTGGRQTARRGERGILPVEPARARAPCRRCRAQLRPGSSALLHHKALVLLAQNRNVDNVVPLLDKALEANPHDKAIWATKGDALKLQGRGNDAAEATSGPSSSTSPRCSTSRRRSRRRRTTRGP